MKRSLLHDRAGICLAEAMIAMAAGVVVLSASIQALHHFERRFGSQWATIAHHQDLRIGLKVFEDELRLAGKEEALSGTTVLKAEAEELIFLANLAGLTTSVTQPVSPGQQQLAVGDGSDWPKGKRIVICSEQHCEEGRLARDGQKTTLSLTDPLTQVFPIGSTVTVTNQVRYYLGRDSRGKAALMRQVDGGASTLIGDVTRFALHYLGRDGKPTQDHIRVARVLIELAVGDGRVIKSEVGLRHS